MSSVFILEGEVGRLLSSELYWNGLFDWDETSRGLFVPINTPEGDIEGSFTSILGAILPKETTAVFNEFSFKRAAAEVNDEALLKWDLIEFTSIKSCERKF